MILTPRLTSTRAKKGQKNKEKIFDGAHYITYFRLFLLSALSNLVCTEPLNVAPSSPEIIIHFTEIARYYFKIEIQLLMFCNILN